MSSNQKNLLRFTTVGSVDDGKSTLVGRLLFDTKSILVDTLAAIESASKSKGLTATDLALLTDGLRSEREQGITIDVAYRYFSTPKRSFILNDTPGHVQYTRNMITGASNANVALILVDARTGIIEQTRRHLTILSILRMARVVLVVNKMDLVEYQREIFDRINSEFKELANSLGINEYLAVPVSALDGDNVVHRSEAMDWYIGPTVLDYLEEVEVDNIDITKPFRFPVQYVIRPRDDQYHDYRGYSGKVSSGAIRVGDQVLISPDGKKSTVTAIDGLSGPQEEAFESQSVSLLLADDFDISRGTMITSVDKPAEVSNLFVANIAVLSDHSISPGEKVLIQQGTALVLGIVEQVHSRFDLDSLQFVDYNEDLALNEIGVVQIKLSQNLALDRYNELTRTGAFLIVSPLNGSTLAAGMVTSIIHPDHEI